MTFTSPLKLRCSVQNYSWGRPAKQSIIGALCTTTDSTLAELWMGAHPSLPSEVLFNGKTVSLPELLKKHPQEILGEAASKKFNNSLPFLFKILSIGTSLSIQAHPDKMRAAELHAKDPKHYPDTNHKPEMGVALEKVELLYGFRDAAKIKADIKRLPEFAHVIEEEALSQNSNEQAILQHALEHLLRSSEEKIRTQCKALIARLQKLDTKTPEDTWVLKLAPLFPDGDRGLFFFYLLNLVTLQPGEAIFIGQNILHAYLSGEVVECMANSDNVVRAGLTPKFQDAPTLLAMADYSIKKPTIIKPNGNIVSYLPPAEEFKMTMLKGDIANHSLEKGKPAILLCISGDGFLEGPEKISLSRGDIYFLPAALAEQKITLRQGHVFIASVP